MIFALLAALVVQLPFASSPLLATVAGIPVTPRGLTVAAALAAAAPAVLRRNARFDLLDWSLLAYAAAWLAAALGAYLDWPAALRASLTLVSGATLCLFVRAALPARDPRRLRVWLAAGAVAAGVAAVVVAGLPARPVPRSDLAAGARLAFGQHPVFGWGPGQFRQFTARWVTGATPQVHLDPPDLYLHHLADGGGAAAAALALLALAALSTIAPRARGRRRDPASLLGGTALFLWLAWGLVASPLLAAGPMLALMLALGLSAPKR